MQLSTYNSPLGQFYLLFAQGVLVHASFDQEDLLKWQRKNFSLEQPANKPLQQEQIHKLNAYFLGQPLAWPWPYKLIGTTFQKRVWQTILEIPHGQFTTYKQIGKKINSKAYQAIGQAVGANPISILVPCHRVLGTNWFGGYGGGLARKRLLLELENVTLAPNLNA